MLLYSLLRSGTQGRDRQDPGSSAVVLARAPICRLPYESPDVRARCPRDRSTVSPRIPGLRRGTSEQNRIVRG